MPLRYLTRRRLWKPPDGEAPAARYALRLRGRRPVPRAAAGARSAADRVAPARYEGSAAWLMRQVVAARDAEQDAWRAALDCLDLEALARAQRARRAPNAKADKP